MGDEDQLHDFISAYTQPALLLLSNAILQQLLPRERVALLAPPQHLPAALLYMPTDVLASAASVALATSWLVAQASVLESDLNRRVGGYPAAVCTPKQAAVPQGAICELWWDQQCA
jgi:hypothetical protein